ncbi:MAG TPA: protein phosphatase 2C domain-containing protein [Terracidiphilus sp.]|jgi:protein phosphatase|nr:protein phosphatase 2C domain-containing protein [Terracidiphilus sp.]
MLEVQFGQSSDPGKVRTNNEDAMGSFIPSSRQQARSHGFLFAVADGVGGLDLGEVASSTAISVLTEEFAKAQAGAMLISLLPRLITFANAAVHDRTLTPEYRGKKMATTVVACAMRHDQAIVSHVGDSRCYLVRDGKAKQITQDHTWVNEQKKLGLITEREIAESNARHVLIRSLGPEMFVSPDTIALTLQPGDTLVLCTDGLHDEMASSMIAEIVTQQKSLDQIARDLVKRAVEIDGNDNTTAQVIRVRSVEQVGMYRGRPYTLPSYR